MNCRPKKGVHIESAAVALGALAGVGCQTAVATEIDETGSYQGLSVVEVVGANGEKYLYGDAINSPLLESPDSVWSLVSGTAVSLGATVPDIEDLLRHVADTVGTDQFGVPRYAEGTWSESPRSFRPPWGKFGLAFRESAPRIEQWYQVSGVTLQKLLGMVDGRFDLEPLVRISMESAIAMAKLEQN